ncbi:MAG: DUF433 domain-containing protein [Ignavibacteriales bacterium]|nr:DUF433 domain-containing protein [Ignavibacteriales bacterium]
METLLRQQRIVQSPDVCGNQPRIANTRIRVIDIAIAYEYNGLSPDEIVSQLESITLSDVFAALEYYFDYHDEFQKKLQEEDKLVEQLRKTLPSILDRTAVKSL